MTRTKSLNSLNNKQSQIGKLLVDILCSKNSILKRRKEEVQEYVMQRLSIGQITGELKKQIEEEVMHIFSTAPA